MLAVDSQCKPARVRRPSPPPPPPLFLRLSSKLSAGRDARRGVLPAHGHQRPRRRRGAVLSGHGGHQWRGDLLADLTSRRRCASLSGFRVWHRGLSGQHRRRRHAAVSAYSHPDLPSRKPAARARPHASPGRPAAARPPQQLRPRHRQRRQHAPVHTRHALASAARERGASVRGRGRSRSAHHRNQRGTVPDLPRLGGTVPSRMPPSVTNSLSLSLTLTIKARIQQTH